MTCHHPHLVIILSNILYFITCHHQQSNAGLWRAREWYLRGRRSWTQRWWPTATKGEFERALWSKYQKYLVGRGKRGAALGPNEGNPKINPGFLLPTFYAAAILSVNRRVICFFHRQSIPEYNEVQQNTYWWHHPFISFLGYLWRKHEYIIIINSRR